MRLLCISMCDFRSKIISFTVLSPSYFCRILHGPVANGVLLEGRSVLKGDRLTDSPRHAVRTLDKALLHPRLTEPPVGPFL